MQAEAAPEGRRQPAANQPGLLHAPPHREPAARPFFGACNPCAIYECGRRLALWSMLAAPFRGGMPAAGTGQGWGWTSCTAVAQLPRGLSSASTPPLHLLRSTPTPSRARPQHSKWRRCCSQATECPGSSSTPSGKACPSGEPAFLFGVPAFFPASLPFRRDSRVLLPLLQPAMLQAQCAAAACALRCCCC